MNSFLIPAAATALILTGTQVATAGSGCGMYKSNYHRAVMTHQGYGYHGYHGYGRPQAYKTGYHGQMKQGGYGEKAMPM